MVAPDVADPILHLPLTLDWAARHALATGTLSKHDVSRGMKITYTLRLPLTLAPLLCHEHAQTRLQEDETHEAEVSRLPPSQPEPPETGQPPGNRQTAGTHRDHRQKKQSCQAYLQLTTQMSGGSPAKTTITT